eukprot:TRINITY_DN2406_c0_g2_i3.p1 TRINITY_DN2406_c0_g2~~TRINITY_DN2406_c0_g2_i3.p1  ORF type:complete len:444 (-),score=65.34 TRINITY_DN2406_c0_g2_i3:750-2081(-)
MPTNKRKHSQLQNSWPEESPLGDMGVLPDELLLLVLFPLPAEALGRIMCACKTFARLGRDDRLWKRLASQRLCLVLEEPVGCASFFQLFRRLAVAPHPVMAWWSAALAGRVKPGRCALVDGHYYAFTGGRLQKFSSPEAVAWEYHQTPSMFIAGRTLAVRFPPPAWLHRSNPHEDYDQTHLYDTDLHLIGTVPTWRTCAFGDDAIAAFSGDSGVSLFSAQSGELISAGQLPSPFRLEESWMEFSLEPCQMSNHFGFLCTAGSFLSPGRQGRFESESRSELVTFDRQLCLLERRSIDDVVRNPEGSFHLEEVVLPVGMHYLVVRRTRNSRFTVIAPHVGKAFQLPLFDTPKLHDACQSSGSILYLLVQPDKYESDVQLFAFNGDADLLWSTAVRPTFGPDEGLSRERWGQLSVLSDSVIYVHFFHVIREPYHNLEPFETVLVGW